MGWQIACCPFISDTLLEEIQKKAINTHTMPILIETLVSMLFHPTIREAKSGTQAQKGGL